MTAPVETYEPSTGRSLRLRRSWPRDDGHLLVEYARPDDTTVAGQWFADGARLARVAARTPAPATVVRGTGVLLQPSGADRKLPVVSRLLRRSDATLVAHRPERRAVVRLDEGYLKVTRPGRAAAPVDLAALGGFAFPRLLRHDPDVGTTLWSAVPGTTLYDAGADPSRPDAELRRAWTAVGRGLRTLHDTPTCAGWPRHDATAEHATTRRWLDAAVRYRLLPAFDVDAALASLCAQRAGPVGLLHRDLHDKQLILRPDGGIGLVDLDTLAVGERALDLANLLVHLELRTAQGVLPGRRAAAARASLLAGYDADAATLARVPAHVTATRLRLRAVYAFRPTHHG